MSYYLQHYFDPDMTHLQPKRSQGNKTDLYNLGFVQNVQEQQVLAEFIPLHLADDIEKRFVYKQPIFPIGQNTHVDPNNPRKLLASTKGYVLYNAEKIMVETSLTINSDISFHTGNINFVGDTTINGNVRSGFSVCSENIQINGMVEGGKAKAVYDLNIVGGAKGGVSNHGKLKAGNNIRLAFAEKIEIQSRGNLLIRNYVLHSDTYVSGNAIIQKHLIGGSLQALKGVYVGEQLGNRAHVCTRIFLGYDPMLMRKLDIIEKRIEDLTAKLHHLNLVAGHLHPDANELSKKLARLRKKEAAYIGVRSRVWLALNEEYENVRLCKIVAAGDVFPGVEIAIGRAFLHVDEPLHSVEFTLNENDEIVYTPHIPKAKI